MNELALFAGAGGGILAGKLLGWRTVCAVEIEEYPRNILLARQDDGTLPPFPIWDDVRTFDGRPWRGLVDVVSGGFPCQDISVCGNGTGLDGSRSGLWTEMRRIIGEVRPRLVFVENSPALAFRGGARVIGDLAAMGYMGRNCCLGGFSVGGCANGERMWIVATSSNGAMLEGLDLPKLGVAYTEESCRRQYTRAVGAMLTQDDYTEIKRNPDDVADGMDRLKAIGNGQNPYVAALAWHILAGGADMNIANAPAQAGAVATSLKPVVGCSHDWREPVDTQFCNETHTEVKCTKCGMVGEKTLATGEVFFPAT